MAAFTKEIIVRTVMDLLNERPLSQITVKDVVEKCGINRNTFYYHFRDIRDVMEYAMKNEMDQIMQEYVGTEDVLEGLIRVMERFQENKKAILHIYRSMDRAMLQHQLDALCEYLVSRYVWNSRAWYVNTPQFSEEDRRLLKNVEKCLLEGVLLDWLEHGMSEDLGAGMRRLIELTESAPPRPDSEAERGGELETPPRFARQPIGQPDEDTDKFGQNKESV